MKGAIILLILSLFLTIAPLSPGNRTNFRVATRQAVPVLHSDVIATRDSSPVVKVMLMEVSAYSPTVQECDSAPLTTASGKRVYVGGIAADWGVLPCGSIVTIENYNGGKPCQVIDTGSMIRGNTLDVFFWHEQEAINWGRRRNVEVQVLYVPGGTP